MPVGNKCRDYRLNVLIKRLIYDIQKDGFVGDLVRVSNEHSKWVSRFKDSPITIQDHLIWSIFKYEGKALANYCKDKEEITIEYLGKIKIKPYKAANIELVHDMIIARGYSDIKEVPKDELKEIGKIVRERLTPLAIQSRITRKKLNSYNSHIVIDSNTCPNLTSKLFKNK